MERECEGGLLMEVESQKVESAHRGKIFVLPAEASCFLCSASYFASLGSNSEETRDRILSICRAFGIHLDSEKSLLLKLIVADPFCLTCCETTNQLNGWLVQLDLVQDRINAMKKLVSQSVLRTCPSEGRSIVLNDEYIKTKILERYKGMSSVPYINPTPIPRTVTQNDNELRLCYESPDKYTINYNDLIHVQFPVAVSHEPEPDTMSSPSDNEPNSDVHDFFDEMGIADSLEVVETTVRSPVKKRRSRSSGVVRRKKSPSRRKSNSTTADLNGQCHLCTKCFPTQFALNRHIKRQHSGTTFPCRYCDKTFSGTSNRARHEVAIHIATTRDFICEICGKDFRTKPSLQEHHKITHMKVVYKNRESRPTTCEDCGKVLSSAKNLGTHIRLMHRRVTKMRICPICGKPCHNISTLRKHEVSHKSPWERAVTEGITLFYKCELCPIETQIGFNSKASLAEHYAVEHADEPRPVSNIKKIQTKPKKRSKRFVCEECPHKPSYTTSFSLRMHVMSGHVNKRRLEPGTPKLRFYCEICGKPCKDRYAAQQHVKTHNPKPEFRAVYDCTVCENEEGEATFYKIKDFRRHYSLCHPDEDIPEIKPFNTRKSESLIKCPECPENIGFTTASGLRSHIRNGHGKKKRGKKSNVEKGLPPPRKKRSTRKKGIKVEVSSSDSDSESSEAEDTDDLPNTADKRIVPPSPKKCRPIRKIKWPARFNHKNEPEMKELRVRLTRL